VPLKGIPQSERVVVGQLLKWIGNKYRVAPDLVRHFPSDFGTYREPFLGAGSVLAQLNPERAVGSDVLSPLIEIWNTLRDDPEELIRWYSERYFRALEEGREVAYYAIRDDYNASPNGADLLFICRACYGGVVRFRKRDGAINTPCGVHPLIPPESFRKRVERWRPRTAGARFEVMDYGEAMGQAVKGDLVYCDPPYTHSQTVLYGSQAFRFSDLLAAIEGCKSRGARVALSIDGRRFSGRKLDDVPLPEGLFERELFLDCGRSLLRRFKSGMIPMGEDATADRLLLTY
jgi:DNA adenine methylase